MNPLLKLYKLTLDILFPLACVDCNKHIENDELGPICELCINSVIVGSIPTTAGIKIYAVGSYNDQALVKLIHTLKYKRITSVKRSLEFLIEKYLERNPLGLSLSAIPANTSTLSSSGLTRGSRVMCKDFWIPDQVGNDSPSNTIIIPIPLHRKRERYRGFNQSEIIANLLAQKIGGEVSKNILKRIRKTKPQVECKNYEERAKNIKDCFKVINPEKIIGKNIILVDDVYTSGGTIKEAVKILKKNGSKNIEAFVIAKT